MVAPVRVDPRGLRGPTRAQARGVQWRRTSQGWYVPAWTDTSDPWQRIAEASVWRGSLTGWAALCWEEGRWFDGTRYDGSLRDVPLATGGRTVRPQRGVDISEELMSPADRTVRHGLAMTRSLRSVTFEMRRADTVDAAVGILDMAAFSDLVSVSEVAAYVSAMTAMTGIIQCRRALAFAAENSWSWQETRMRMVWTRALEVRLLCNVPIFDRRGRHIGTPDLLDPVAGVVGEYDGALHLAAARRGVDIRREHDFREAGLDCVPMMTGDWRDLDRFVSRVRGAYGRAGRRTGERSWTLEAPDWWIPTETVAQRRALDPWTRKRLLAHRRPA